jgi:hypothetical protein
MPTEKELLVQRGPHDLGGLDAGPVERQDRDLLPWEKRCNAVSNVLATRGLVSTEEKRRAVENLGGEAYGKLGYYERWVVAIANLLIEKNLLSSEEIGKKLAEIEAREAEGEG